MKAISGSHALLTNIDADFRNWLHKNEKAFNPPEDGKNYNQSEMDHLRQCYDDERKVDDRKKKRDERRRSRASKRGGGGGLD